LFGYALPKDAANSGIGTPKLHMLARLLFISLIFSGRLLTGAGLSITDVKFYNMRDKRPPGDPISDSYPREKIKRLYARFTILGSADTIAYLEKHGYLKIIVEWRVDGRVLDSPDVGISQEKWESSEEQLKKQSSEDGYFAFRTCSYRTYIPKGSYGVTIRDGEGNILSPSGFLGPGIYQPTINIIPP
jgi:hypothetical protein